MMNLRRLVILAGMTSFSFAVQAAGIGDDSRNEGIVHGYVVDAITKKPVAGVTVSAASRKAGVSKEVATDASGYFKINQLPEGDLSLQFGKKGYRNLRKESVALKNGTMLKVALDIMSEKESVVSPEDIYHPVLRLVDGIW